MEKYQPKSFKTKLFYHQLRAVKLMEEQENQFEFIKNGQRIVRRVNVLGDMTGFGKTYEMLALIARTKNRWIKLRRNEELLFHMYDNEKEPITKIKRIDVYITPLHLIRQLEQEVILRTNIKYVKFEKHADFSQELGNADLVLLCNSVASTFLSCNKQPLYRIIIDEADTTKLPRSEIFMSLKVEFFWLMTATYQSFLQPQVDLGSVFLTKLVNTPGFKANFEHFLVKNSDQMILDSFSRNFEVIETEYQCRTSTLINSMLQYVDDDIQDDLRNGKISTAMNKLGAKKTGNLSKVIQNNIEQEIKRNKNNEKEIERLNKKLQNLLSDIKKLAQEPCIICYDECSDGEQATDCTVTPCCQHLACSECLVQWIIQCKKTHKALNCPCCRMPMSADGLMYLASEVVDEEDDRLKIENDSIVVEETTDNFVDNAKKVTADITKEGKISAIIKNNPNGYFLIYSELHQMTEIAHEIGSQAREVKGSRIEQEKIIDGYQKGLYRYLFMNPLSKAAGLNLEMTTDIIMFKRYKKETMIQIRGRALRMNRKNNIPLNIHILTYTNDE